MTESTSMAVATPTAPVAWEAELKAKPPAKGKEPPKPIADILAAKSPLALRGAKWSANEVERLFTDFELANRAIESRA